VVVSASLAAICGGCALAGRWPLAAAAVALQLLVALAWLAVTNMQPLSRGLLIAAATAVAADVYLGRADGDLGPLSVIVAAAFLASLLAQLVRRTRTDVARSTAAVAGAVIAVVFLAQLAATRALNGGEPAAAALCFGVAASGLVRGAGNRVLPRPRLTSHAAHGWFGLVASVAAGAVAGAYAGQAGSGLDFGAGALIGGAAAIAAAAGDLGMHLGSHLLAGDGARSAVAPLAVLMPLVLAAPVGYGVARMLAT
jgi:hypothetical protein